MQNYHIRGHLFAQPVRRAFALILMLAMTLGVTCTIVSAEPVYVIYDGDTRSIVESHGYTTAAILADAGIEVEPCDRVSAERNEYGTMELTITRAQQVAIRYQGATLHVNAYNETVSALLLRVGITPSETTVASIDLSNATENGMVIDVTTFTYEEIVVAESIPYTTERRANASMTKGKEKVVQAGQNGSKDVTYRITYADGVEVGREAVASAVTAAATTEIVEYGTKAATITRSDRVSNDQRSSNGSGVLTFQSGDTITYSRALTVSATAYTAKPGAKTASGKAVYVGGIATDPRVIPMGTKMYIQTSNGNIIYGIATAIDTGSAIKGNKIDLFFSTYEECVQFGRRNCTVYILN